MFFNVLADATEENSKLGAQAIGVAHRTHVGLLDATGVNKIIPSPVKELTDGVYRTNQKLVLGAGNKSAKLLRKLDKRLDALKLASGSGNARDDGDDDGDSQDDDEYDGQDDEEPGLTHGDQGPYPDSPDSRDHQFEYFAHVSLGRHVDLRHTGHCPPVYNQRSMASCTAHAVAGAFEFEVQKQGLPEFSPSRLFIWYNARAKSHVPHATKKNVGSSLREAIKSLNFKEHGVCSEGDWSYEIGKSNRKTRYFLNHAKAARKPPAIVEKHAHLHTAAKYRAIRSPNLREKLIQCLDRGYPFVFGMRTYGLLSNVDKHGRGLEPPSARDKKNGAHAHSVMAVGYIEEEEVFIVRNSWGAHWGQDGHFYMPYEYLVHCYDFWTISLVHNGAASGHHAAKGKGRK